MTKTDKTLSESVDGHNSRLDLARSKLLAGHADWMRPFYGYDFDDGRRALEQTVAIVVRDLASARQN